MSETDSKFLIVLKAVEDKAKIDTMRPKDVSSAGAAPFYDYLDDRVVILHNEQFCSTCFGVRRRDRV